MGTSYPGMSLGGNISQFKIHHEGIPFTTKSWVENGTSGLATSGFPLSTGSSTINSLMTKGTTAIASRSVPATTMLR